jgi:hypothetical protein
MECWEPVRIYTKLRLYYAFEALIKLSQSGNALSDKKFEKTLDLINKGLLLIDDTKEDRLLGIRYLLIMKFN